MGRVIKDHKWIQKYGADKREDGPWTVDQCIWIEYKIHLFYMQIRTNKKYKRQKIKRTACYEADDKWGNKLRL